MTILGVHGSHNTAFVLIINNILVEVLELERFISVKNAALFYYYGQKNPEFLIKECLNYFREKYYVNHFDKVRSNSFEIEEYKHLFNTKDFKYVPHHRCHAYSSLHQSNHEEALIFSFDGGSDEGFFNVFKAHKKNGVENVGKNEYDICVPYAIPGHYCKEIRREGIFWGNLVYPGKIMGLAAYGKVDMALAFNIERFYRETTTDNIPEAEKRFRDYTGITEPIEGANLAATNQYVFEKLFYEIYTKYKKLYPDLPVHLTGGGALNILNNSKIRELEGEVSIFPNCNDTSIALGAALSEVNTDKPIDVTYIGPEVFDKKNKAYYLKEYHILGVDDLVEDIIKGKIIGVVNGRCENGPRALGNRSIICSPGKGMKDILNKKVKGREYYRPFAPIVRLKDVNKYFEFEGESRWMTFAAKVREEYKEDLESVCHEDGTARIQTITAEQNGYIYSILDKLENKGALPVIINTSFNKAGKPILNTYKEAFEILEESDMDSLCIDYTYIRKEQKHDKIR